MDRQETNGTDTLSQHLYISAVDPRKPILTRGGLEESILLLIFPMFPPSFNTAAGDNYIHQSIQSAPIVWWTHLGLMGWLLITGLRMTICMSGQLMMITDVMFVWRERKKMVLAENSWRGWGDVKRRSRGEESCSSSCSRTSMRISDPVFEAILFVSFGCWGWGSLNPQSRISCWTSEVLRSSHLFSQNCREKLILIILLLLLFLSFVCEKKRHGCFIIFMILILIFHQSWWLHGYPSWPSCYWDLWKSTVWKLHIQLDYQIFTGMHQIPCKFTSSFTLFLIKHCSSSLSHHFFYSSPTLHLFSLDQTTVSPPADSVFLFFCQFLLDSNIVMTLPIHSNR